MYLSTNYLLLGFGFTNLIALGWLAAAAAPILIHLWMRQTHRTTPWAAYRFLKAALERQARRLRIQHWILLTIRTAILVLIALAAAKPYLENSLLSSSSEPIHRILIVDNSLSMAYSDKAEETRFDRAILLAKSLVNESNTQDRFTISLTSNQKQTASAQIGVDRSTALKTLETALQTPSKSDCMASLRMVENLISTIESDPTLPNKLEVLYFTDLLSSDWQSFQEGLDAEKDKLLKTIIAQSPIKLVDCGSSSTENYAVTSLRCTNRLPTTEQDLEFSALIQSYGDAVTKKISAELLINGISVDHQEININDKATEILFNAKVDSVGAHSITAQISNDSLKADNERHLAMNLKDAMNILCVEGRPRAAQHVADALNPTLDERFPLQPEVVAHSDLSSIELNRFDCVIFCNVPDFSVNESLQIKQYCLQGGGAIFFLGDQVLPDRYEGILSSDAGLLSKTHRTPFKRISYTSTGVNNEQPLLPITIKDSIRVSTIGIDPLDYQHPITQPFEGNERAGLLNTPITRIYGLELTGEADSNKTEVALATASGDPLLITSHYGSGKIAIMTTDGSLQSIDPQTGEPWTAMPAWPSFLPLVRGMVQSVLSLSNDIGSYEVGHELIAPASGSKSILRPDDSEELLGNSSSQIEVYTRTDQIGFYDFIDQSQNVISRKAINSNSVESDTARILPGSLDPRFTLISQDSLGTSLSLSQASTQGIHRNLLFLALLLVLLETGIACWFGRGRA